jgi:hypothetical protein
MSPGAGFGFLLFAGDSHVVSQLILNCETTCESPAKSKKPKPAPGLISPASAALPNGQPDPFVFLDCPSKMNIKDTDTTFTARVICLSDVHTPFSNLETTLEIITETDDTGRESRVCILDVHLALPR